MKTETFERKLRKFANQNGLRISKGVSYRIGKGEAIRGYMIIDESTNSVQVGCGTVPYNMILKDVASYLGVDISENLE